jgi:hypothetical protein
MHTHTHTDRHGGALNAPLGHCRRRPPRAAHAASQTRPPAYLAPSISGRRRAYCLWTLRVGRRAASASARPPRPAGRPPLTGARWTLARELIEKCRPALSGGGGRARSTGEFVSSRRRHAPARRRGVYTSRPPLGAAASATLAPGAGQLPAESLPREKLAGRTLERQRAAA